MHLGNGFICPVTGLPMLAVAAGTAFYAFKKAKKDLTKDKIMPAVMLSALVFALLMILPYRLRVRAVILWAVFCLPH